MTTWSNDSSNTRVDLEDTSQRTTHVLSHLSGALDETMLAAISGVWSTLEHAATNPSAHARAVRSRLFWETLEPGGVAAAPVSVLAAIEEVDHDLGSGSPDVDEVAFDEAAAA